MAPGADRRQGPTRTKPSHGDQIHGIVLENAGQLAACVSLYSPSGDILYLAINAGNLHCQRVGQCHVTVKARDKNRMIRGYGVNP